MTISDQLVMLWRGLTLRCPRCESGDLFHRWTEMVDECPRCELTYEHEEGYWLGAIAINTVVTLFFFSALMGLITALTWPNLPVLALILGGIVLGIVFPLFFYPVSKTLWVAFDLAFLHPLRPWRRRKRE